MWINNTTGKVLLTHSDIRNDARNISFPSTMTDTLLTAFGYLQVTPVTPSFNPMTQKAVETAPKLTGQVWSQQWVITDLTVEQVEAARKAAVPASISPRQIRQALSRAGLRSSVEAAVAAGDQDTKDWYEFATTFERDNPQVVSMGAALGVTPLQLDGLWTLGATM